VRDLLEGGRVDIQAHSLTHPCLTLLTEDELEREVAGSKEELEKIVGAPVSIFSYPAGIYGAREVRAVQRASFRAALTTRPGVNTDATPLHELRRTMIYWRDSPADFAAKLRGALDQPSYVGARVHSRRSRPRRDRGKAMRADI
jgi:peptidoglycan/xylan/chitin deacetylase (PgdA/CDA1 family)